ncbi:alpha/beta fold hydrolase [Pseudobacteriovorax antillogorgiicola]|uniref:Uncharacterized protein n=1 Tax=Pseudobacteriovorax antillogorgiicola TaxID=1513793 RepID=A0A1Y6CRQ5_9BACT|nr:hypothetical protein [Pseudobacteriovorax antillogorgiicola]TCS40916.1 hypothetical protein EDD56_1512 [Pseudobacteriovorax antillogorgiicola]SMF83958.1 hypothetical protein SAMN06296036_1512 [Pseudobacteriovorax antillogorgiicola]
MNRKQVESIVSFVKYRSIWVHGASSPLGLKLAEILLLLGARVYATDQDLEPLKTLQGKFKSRLVVFQFNRGSQTQIDYYLSKLKDGQVKLLYFFDLQNPRLSQMKDMQVLEPIQIAEIVEQDILGHLKIMEGLKEGFDEDFRYICLVDRHSTSKSESSIHETLQLSYLRLHLLKQIDHELRFFLLRPKQCIETMSEPQRLRLIVQVLTALVKKKPNYYQTRWELPYQLQLILSRVLAWVDAWRPQTQIADAGLADEIDQVIKSAPLEDQDQDNPFLSDSFPTSKTASSREDNTPKETLSTEQEGDQLSTSDNVFASPPLGTKTTLGKAAKLDYSIEGDGVGGRICLLQDPFFPSSYWLPFKDKLIDQGLKVLTLHWDEWSGSKASWYPDVKSELLHIIHDNGWNYYPFHMACHGWSCMPFSKDILELESLLESLILISPMGLHSETSKFERMSRWSSVLGKNVLARSLQQEICPGLDIASTEFWKRMPKRAAKDHYRVIYHLQKHFVAEDCYSQLAKIRVPSLLVMGIQTERYLEPIHPMFKEWNPQTKLVPIQEGHHHTPISHPEELSEAFTHFFEYIINHQIA